MGSHRLLEKFLKRRESDPRPAGGAKRKKKKDHVKFVGEIPDGGPRVVAFPTDQRLRDKARKAETGEKKEVKEKKHVVEQVFDDCGED